MATIISNQATATYNFDGSDLTRSTTSNTVNTTVRDNYCVEIVKHNNNECFTPGENLTFTIEVTNCGCKSLRNFIITDNLGLVDDYRPLTYLDGTSTLIMNGNFTNITPTDTEPLTYEVPNTLNAGDSFFITYTVTVDPEISSEIMEIVNTVVVTATPCDSCCGCNGNTVTQTVTASASSTTPRCVDANLVIFKEVNKDHICNCDSVEYTITLRNTGLTDATNVVVTDVLPAGFTINNIHIINDEINHNYDASEYTVDGSNLLTLPNNTGTVINVRSVEPGVNHDTIVTITGTYNL